ncbi:MULTISPECIES: sodium:solute symporter [unclassified Paraeggerthella]|uniref:sodium:solute symporter n=1 Tax=unclassified Paraeggerthella TaxID=2641972 RepID=UPI001CE46846|nr:sodium:solute symporter [Paraeggerthella sp. Marseille-Q4926]MDY3981627.1 sodium:solute symporter [Paraeggerthella sp.]
MALSSIDYVIIALYFVAIVTIGFVAARFTKTQEDYLVAGRRLSFPLFFGCMAALTLGGGSTIGSAQLGYQFGFGGIWLNLSIGFGLIVAGFLVTSKLSKLRALSVNEVVESSYGPTARVFSSVLTLIYTLTLSVVQVISIGTIINGTIGLDPTLSMALGGGIVILYTFVGGMWSVTMTDIVQFVVKTIGILILAPLFCISAAGGWDALVSKVPEAYLSVGSMGFDKSFSYIVLYVPGLIIGQDIWQRIFTAKDEKVSKRGTIGAGLYSIMYAFATVIVGMSVAVLLPHLDNPQNAFVTGISTFLPVGIRGLVLAAAMAATMSVSSGTILASSTILYNDLYVRFGGKRSRHLREVTATRLSALIIGIIVMICSLWINDVLVGIDICYGYLSGCVFVPLVASFVLKRFSPRAGLYALGVSSVAVTVSFLTVGTASSIPIVAGMGSGLIVYTIANAVSKKKIPSPLHERLPENIKNGADRLK